jgi:hypothetical protein
VTSLANANSKTRWLLFFDAMINVRTAIPWKPLCMPATIGFTGNAWRNGLQVPELSMLWLLFFFRIDFALPCGCKPPRDIELEVMNTLMNRFRGEIKGEKRLVLCLSVMLHTSMFIISCQRTALRLRARCERKKTAHDQKLNNQTKRYKETRPLRSPPLLCPLTSILPHRPLRQNK